MNSTEMYEELTSSMDPMTGTRESLKACLDDIPSMYDSQQICDGVALGSTTLKRVGPQEYHVWTTITDSRVSPAVHHDVFTCQRLPIPIDMPNAVIFKAKENRRLVRTMERLKPNVPIVTPKGVSMRCYAGGSAPPYEVLVSFNSDKSDVLVHIPYTDRKHKFPYSILDKAFKGDQEALDYIESVRLKRQNDEPYISRTRPGELISNATDVLMESFAHISSMESKRIMLGILRNILLEEDVELTRDHTRHKLLLLPGDCMKLLCISAAKYWITELQKAYSGDIPAGHVPKLPKLRPNDTVVNAIASGDWSRADNIPTRYTADADASVSIPLSSEASHWSCFCKSLEVYTPAGKGAKSGGATGAGRDVREDAVGCYCPSATPEGENCGLTKTLCFTAVPSPEPTQRQLQDCAAVIIDVTRADIEGVPVMLNGVPVALTTDAQRTVKDLRSLRAKRVISGYTSISVIHGAVWVDLTGRRICRPLYEDGADRSQYLTYAEMLSTGTVFMADASEVSSLDEFLSKCLHPAQMFSHPTLAIPYFWHNQSPRVSYGVCMVQHAVKTWYSQRMPDRRTYKSSVLTVVPEGAQPIIAIGTFASNTEEDAMQVNQGSIDRGLFALDTTRVYHDQNPASKPLVAKGDTVSEGRMLTDTGLVMPKYEKGVVVSVECLPSGTHVTVSVPLGLQRGDKICTMHGQKGIVGSIIPEEDMPFDRHGVRPDVIMSPMGFVSRMTIGQLWDMLVNTLAMFLSKDSIASIPSCPYETDSLVETMDANEIIREFTKEAGFERIGMHVLTDGRTGERIRTQIFMAPVWMGRLLDHTASKKVQSRPMHGPVSAETWQPSRGRSCEGGLRVGYMEKDALLVQMLPTLLNSYMGGQSSDKYTMWYCNECGMAARALHIPVQMQKLAEFKVSRFHGQLPHAGLACDFCNTESADCKGFTERTCTRASMLLREHLLPVLGLGFSHKPVEEQVTQPMLETSKRTANEMDCATVNSVIHRVKKQCSMEAVLDPNIIEAMPAFAYQKSMMAALDVKVAGAAGNMVHIPVLAATNPTLLPRGTDKQDAFEGCPSLPWLANSVVPLHGTSTGLSVVNALEFVGRGIPYGPYPWIASLAFSWDRVVVKPYDLTQRLKKHLRESVLYKSESYRVYDHLDGSYTRVSSTPGTIPTKQIITYLFRAKKVPLSTIVSVRPTIREELTEVIRTDIQETLNYSEIQRRSFICCSERCTSITLKRVEESGYLTPGVRTEMEVDITTPDSQCIPSIFDAVLE